MIDLYKLWENKKTMPVITVEHGSGKVLMLGYMNKEAFAYTLKTRRAYYYDSQTDEVYKFGANPEPWFQLSRWANKKGGLCRLTLTAAATLCS